MPRYCSNPDCVGYRSTGASSQYANDEASCALCGRGLIDADGDPVGLSSEALKARFEHFARLRLRFLLGLALALVVIGVTSPSLDRLFDWEVGTTAGIVVSLGAAAIIAAGAHRVLTDRSLRRERTPAAESDAPADTGPWPRLEHEFDPPDSGDDAPGE